VRKLNLDYYLKRKTESPSRNGDQPKETGSAEKKRPLEKGRPITGLEHTWIGKERHGIAVLSYSTQSV